MSEKNRSEMKHSHKRNLIVIGVDLALIGATIASFVVYSSDYRAKLKAQNLSDIQNLNTSSAKISSAIFLNSQNRLADIIKYIEKKQFTVSEAMSFIADSSNDANTQFELIGADYTGFVYTKGLTSFPSVEYDATDYGALKTIFSSTDPASFTNLLCTPEFSDRYNGVKSFAIYNYVTISDGAGGFNRYTLMDIYASSSLANDIALDGGYTGMATTLINQNGDYLFGNTDFKSGNLFTFFYKFSNLSLDERNAEYTSFQAMKEGTFYHKDSKGREAVFVYCPVPSTTFYSVSLVPLSSYHLNPLDLNYTFLIAGLILALMIFNVSWLIENNRRLRVSVEKEKVASEAKTDFLSRMSHDIRTPLNVVIGSADLAIDEENNPENTKKYLANIDRSGRLLLALINDILDLNKVESGKMELNKTPYAFEEFSQMILGTVKPLASDKGIDFQIGKTNETMPVLEFDHVRMNQIFYNILSNSVKFTAPGGKISLEVTDTKIDEDHYLATFVCSDTGCGMSEEFQKHMFEVFTQEERSNNTKVPQGTGLGLAIVKNLVELMGGTIKVQSAINKGTTFTIAIPGKVTSLTPQKVEEKEKADTATIYGKRILLCEDNDLNAEIAEKILEKASVSVTRASDGAEGVKLYLLSAPRAFDAILMDMRMPKMTGIEATLAIRSSNKEDAKDIPIIAMTANAFDSDIKNCLDAGMNAHLSKPIEPKKMFLTIAEEIGKHEKALKEKVDQGK
ncbi:MAG: ATP-binding protein [Bacilli bacterium]|jgi:signal transduction histidine kinase/CheY-like chemotaxis protein|nr:ATP-binding protein [Bacilli bacterium]